MTITDNGKGISDMDLQDSKSFGLIGIRERAHMFGGTVAIVGEEGKGTKVSTRIPLKNNVKYGELK